MLSKAARAVAMSGTIFMGAATFATPPSANAEATGVYLFEHENYNTSGGSVFVSGQVFDYDDLTYPQNGRSLLNSVSSIVNDSGRTVSFHRNHNCNDPDPYILRHGERNQWLPNKYNDKLQSHCYE